MTLPWLAFALALALPTALAGSREFATEAMHTRVSVRLPDDAEAPLHAAEVFAIFRAVEAEANEWQEGSPLAKLNAAAGGDPVPLPAHTLALLRRGLAISEASGGKFDITWAALWGLWDFHAARVPTAAEVADRLPLVDYRQLEVGDTAARLRRWGMKVGLGGIAKGWALDRAQALLRGHGRENFLLRAGGQVYAAGHNDEGEPWRVGVRDPDQGPDESIAVLAVSDRSVSTSGVYERYFEVDAVRYHHVLDLATGFPARGVRAATVVSADATLADAASTAIMAAGPDGAAAMARALSVEALWVVDDGTVFQTAGVPVGWRR